MSAAEEIGPPGLHHRDGQPLPGKDRLIPAQELSGETELIAAYDALMRRGDAEREQLKARMPSYMAGREETIAAVLALAGGKRE